MLNQFKSSVLHSVLSSQDWNSGSQRDIILKKIPRKEFEDIDLLQVKIQSSEVLTNNELEISYETFLDLLYC